MNGGQPPTNQLHVDEMHLILVTHIVLVTGVGEGSLERAGN